MIKHVVLFKFKDVNKAFLDEVSKKLMNLNDKIAEIQTIEVGLNENPDEKFHLALTVELEGFHSLKTYVNHPEHLAVGKIIRTKLEDRSCVDYVI